MSKNITFPVVVAVHLISESCDHYTYCIQANSVEDFVNQIKNQNPDFAYCTTQYMKALHGVDVSSLRLALNEAVEAAREAKYA